MSPENSLSAIISVYRYECFLFSMYVGVIGVLAHPSFINDKIREMPSEPKQYLSSMNRGQTAYFAQKNTLANSVEALATGIQTETPNYKYSVHATKQAAFNYGLSKHLKNTSYVGGVFVVPAKEVDQNAAKDELKTIAILCKADFPGLIQVAEPTYQNGKTACGKGTTAVTE
ncbi:type IV pilin-like G/H family protein [Microcoleus sp. bin38.metabat.b11b12b14.051]|uniref:type IV pilin-like G/H family protein n=1 Tax=Microcoleus sp. bin38.metabat.b11b12b14.051 TaxID=2742709 RepID=UPI0025EF0E5A|nr:type IV pilin-like G/H family protein [Microcoleus sp. bin38.metabat.b11b12b14.051]